MSLQATGEQLEESMPAASLQEPPEPTEAVSLIVDKLHGWLQGAIEMLPNLAVAILTLLIFWVLSRIFKRLLGSALEKTPLPVTLRGLVSTAVGVAVVITGAFMALGVLGLDRTVMSLLAGVGIVGLALGFAFQEVAANFIAGVLLSVRRPIRVGEIVETKDLFGTVEEINLRSTLLRRPTGELVFIPNKDVFDNPVINYSRSGRRRVDLNVGVSYGDDLERARQLAIAAVESLERRDREAPIELFYKQFGSSSIDFVIRFWIDFERQTDYLSACSEAIMAIKKSFDEHDITIPFPIRTLDFGIVGGEALGEHLRPLLPQAAEGGGGSRGSGQTSSRS